MTLNNYTITRLDPEYDFMRQSIEIDSKEHIRIATSLGNLPLITSRDEKIRTLAQALERGLQVSSTVFH
jgi:hypothetical protein